MPVSIISQVMFLISSLVGLFLFICLFALPLWGIAYLFKFKKKTFLPALIITAIYFAIMLVITFVPYLISTSILENLFYRIFSYIFNFGVTLLLVKYFYKEKWNKTVLASVIWFAILMLFGLVMRLFVLRISPMFGNFGT